MSLGKGTSGFSPVSTVGMLAFLISFSTNPVQKRKCFKKLPYFSRNNEEKCIKKNRPVYHYSTLNRNIRRNISELHLCGLHLTGAIGDLKLSLDLIPVISYTVSLSGPEFLFVYYLLSFLSISSHLLTSFTNLR